MYRFNCNQRVICVDRYIGQVVYLHTVTCYTYISEILQFYHSVLCLQRGIHESQIFPIDSRRGFRAIKKKEISRRPSVTGLLSNTAAMKQVCTHRRKNRAGYNAEFLLS